jgi:uncharacterized protein
LISKIVMQLEGPYDALLVITRGGIIPGGMIAEALKMKDVLTAAVLFSDTPGVQPKMRWPRFLQFPADPVLAGRKILIVDNLWAHGNTIMTVKGRVEGAGGYPELAVLHWKKSQSLFPEDEPDYYAEITDKWILYPWQRIDDSGDLVKARPILELS